MLHKSTRRAMGVAAALAAATGAFVLTAPAAGAAPSAGSCHTQLVNANIPLGQSAYAVEFGVEQGPFAHDFVYGDLATARGYLKGTQCAGVADVVRAEVTLALAKIDAGEASLRAGDWASSAAALGQAENAVSSASSEVWRLAHPS
jgi:hypothetical protein